MCPLSFSQKSSKLQERRKNSGPYLNVCPRHSTHDIICYAIHKDQTSAHSRRIRKRIQLYIHRLANSYIYKIIHSWSLKFESESQQIQTSVCLCCFHSSVRPLDFEFMTVVSMQRHAILLIRTARIMSGLFISICHCKTGWVKNHSLH